MTHFFLVLHFFEGLSSNRCLGPFLVVIVVVHYFVGPEKKNHSGFEYRTFWVSDIQIVKFKMAIRNDKKTNRKGMLNLKLNPFKTVYKIAERYYSGDLYLHTGFI